VGIFANSVKFWRKPKSLQLFFKKNERYFENYDTPLLGFNDNYEIEKKKMKEPRLLSGLLEIFNILLKLTCAAENK